MEKLIAAAIVWRKKGETESHMFTATRHPHIFLMFYRMGLPKSERDMVFEKQGFITSELRFVDRYEACKIAQACGQYHGPYVELTSEDVW